MRVVRLPGIHHDASCTLLSAGDETLVVDPGTTWYQANVLERVEANLPDESKVKGILLTHRHYDTAGGAASLSEHWQVPVYAQLDAVQSLRGGDLFTTWASRFNSDMPPTDVLEFDDGAIFEVGDESVEAIHTPGHTSCSTTFWIETEATALVGDLIPKAGYPSRWDLPTGCLPDLVDSLGYLLTLEAEKLVPGHGEAILGTAAVREEIEIQLETLTPILEANGVKPSEWPRPHPTCNWFTPEASLG